MFHARLSLLSPFSVPLLLLLLLHTACAPRINTPSVEKEGILLVAFGTSVPQARETFKKIDEKYRAAFPDCPVEWAFTSQIIRKKLAKSGERTANIGEALEKFSREGIKVVRVQSLHIMAGEEYFGLLRALLYFLQKNPDAFRAVYLGLPLLESRKDALQTAQAIKRNVNHACSTNEAIILMGHGQAQGRAGLALEGARAVLRNEDSHFYLATVEGERDFSELLGEIKKHKVKNVILAPFMLVAGDHARNDLGGKEDDSWASQLGKEGCNVRNVSLKGLGDNDDIVDIFIRHTREAEENLLLTPKKL